MADLQGKLPQPPKKTRKKLVGEAPKLEDRAPSGSFMTRGVRTIHAPTVDSEETCTRGRIQPSGAANHCADLSFKNLSDHPFTDSGAI